MHSIASRGLIPISQVPRSQHSISPYYRGEFASLPSRILGAGVRVVDFGLRSAGTFYPIKCFVRMMQKRMGVSSGFGVGVLHWQAIV